MTMIRTHESSMKIINRKQRVLFTMEDFSNSVIIYRFQQEPTKRAFECTEENIEPSNLGALLLNLFPCKARLF